MVDFATFNAQDEYIYKKKTLHREHHRRPVRTAGRPAGLLVRSRTPPRRRLRPAGRADHLGRHHGQRPYRHRRRLLARRGLPRIERSRCSPTSRSPRCSSSRWRPVTRTTRTSATPPTEVRFPLEADRRPAGPRQLGRRLPRADHRRAVLRPVRLVPDHRPTRATTATFGNAIPAQQARCIAEGVPAGGYEQVNPQIRITVGGNPDLLPEKSESKDVRPRVQPELARRPRRVPRLVQDRDRRHDHHRGGPALIDNCCDSGNNLPVLRAVHAVIRPAPSCPCCPPPRTWVASEGRRLRHDPQLPPAGNRVGQVQLHLGHHLPDQVRERQRRRRQLRRSIIEFFVPRCNKST